MSPIEENNCVKSMSNPESMVQTNASSSINDSLSAVSQFNNNCDKSASTSHFVLESKVQTSAEKSSVSINFF